MDITVFSSNLKQIINGKAELEKITSGFFFTEGPVWDSKSNNLYFTYFNDNTIYTWKEGAGTALFRSDSGRAVGLSMAADGRIVSAETRSHAITFAGAKKSEIIAGKFDGKMLNSPNDVVVRSDGAVYFTDPYSTAMGGKRELDFNGVFCVPVIDGLLSEKAMTVIDDKMERPNGLAFSTDEKILYVNDTNKQLINAYRIREDYTASLIGKFAVLDDSYGPGNADGMKVDQEGNVYLTGPGGIWILDSSGSPAGIIRLPENAGNLCFGGKDNMTLFITATASVYKMPVLIPGIVPKRN